MLMLGPAIIRPPFLGLLQFSYLWSPLLFFFFLGGGGWLTGSYIYIYIDNLTGS